MDVLVNKQSSICIKGSSTLWFDPWDVPEGEKADIIFLTHGHFDHFSPEDVISLTKDETAYVVPVRLFAQENGKAVLHPSRSLPVIPLHQYALGEVFFDTVPSYNINKPFHPRKDSWCGFVVTMDGKRIYVMGDSDATPEAENVKCDILLIPVGGTYTMDWEEAAELAAKISPEIAIPTHYGPVAGDPQDGERFMKRLRELAPEIRVELKLPQL